MITIVRADDWEGLFINDDLQIQGHSLQLRDVLEILGVEFEIKWADKYLSDVGWLPSRLQEVRFDEEYN